MDPFTGCFVPDSTFASLKGFVDTFVHDLLIELENNTSGFHFRKNTCIWFRPLECLWFDKEDHMSLS
jgi:hypothetical protein